MKSFKLLKDDWDLIIEGVENLKNKDFPDLMINMLGEVFTKPDSDAPEELKSEWEEKRRIRLMEEQLKETEKKELLKKIEVLKAKLILMREIGEI